MCGRAAGSAKTASAITRLMATNDPASLGTSMILAINVLNTREVHMRDADW